MNECQNVLPRRSAEPTPKSPAGCKPTVAIDLKDNVVVADMTPSRSSCLVPYGMRLRVDDDPVAISFRPVGSLLGCSQCDSPCSYKTNFSASSSDLTRDSKGSIMSWPQVVHSP